VFHFVPYLQGYRSGLNDMGWRNGDLLNTPREHFRQSLEESPTFMLETACHFHVPLHSKPHGSLSRNFWSHFEYRVEF
jgi:hypothetical protein